MATLHRQPSESYRPSRRRWPWFAGIGLLIAIVVAVVLVVYSGGGGGGTGGGY
jgi:hypothetical protein